MFFPELAFVRNHTCQNEQLSENTFVRIITYQNSNISTRQHLCLAEITFHQKLTFRNRPLPEFYIWLNLYFPEN